MATTMNSLLESLICHVALPPRLPGKEDRHDQLESAIMDHFITASKSMRDITSDETSKNWDWIRRSLEAAKLLNARGRLSKNSLLSEFQTLQQNVYLILNVVEQNAALLIYRSKSGDRVVFEAFETSARAEDVLAAKNALEWDFPGYAVDIPLSTFERQDFLEQLATFLEQASTESIKRFAARTNKAGSLATEARNTVSCALITQMLMTLLEGNGRRIYPSILKKRVQDDVLWFDAEKPWRRSPLYLILRVALQRQLHSMSDLGRTQYKFMRCLAMTQLLEQSFHAVSIESLSFLKTKLCRRLAKLENDSGEVSTVLGDIFEQTFTSLRPVFTKAIQRASALIESQWETFKRSNQRPVMPLPRRAAERDLYLTLPNSGPYLQRIILSESLRPPPRSHNRRIPVDVSSAATKKIGKFGSRYLSLCDMEIGIEFGHSAPSSSIPDNELRCREISKQIKKYQALSEGAYSSNLGESSIMILSIMELWMSMDKCACIVYPLLKDFHPFFTSEMMDVLQLPLYKDMCRLQKVQEYLQGRCSSRADMTIFEDAVRGCFAERYFLESAEAPRLQALFRRIEIDADQLRQKKEAEWEDLSKEHDCLIKTIGETSCMYTVDGHDNRNCTKCFLQRKARRFAIQVHEHPLPSNLTRARVAVFEISCPRTFLVYRDTTWKILNTLALPKKQVGSLEPLEPLVLLEDYPGLSRYVDDRNERGLSLGSTTKSFLKTHYANVRFPCDVGDVCLTNGLKLFYYDIPSKVWTGQECENQRPTFSHHFLFTVPKSSPFSILSPELNGNRDGPSSYEVVASQSRCPRGLNVHEFMAYQALLSGKTRRLPQLVVELGSQNLNFSTEAMAILVSRLILEAGPKLTGDPLRVVHQSYKDKTLCSKMIEQLDQKLDNIRSNYREYHAMELILTILLRMKQLARFEHKDLASNSLQTARTITESWVQTLREEMKQANDFDTASRCQGYCLWAALLCRRTFSYQDGTLLDSTALRCFIECSITLQDNLSTDPAQAPLSLKNAIVRDLKAVYRMRLILRDSLMVSPQSLLLAVGIVWPQPEGSEPRIASSSLSFDSPEKWWVQARIIGSGFMKEQTLSFHLFYGYLLIDGQPLGMLPVEYRTSATLQDLFGDVNLLTFPSSLPGSDLQLQIRPFGHTIHLSFRAKDIVVRAYKQNTILELIPSRVFHSGETNFDLPYPLLMNCIHWFNLTTGIIDIRQKPHIWTSKPSNWQLNVRDRRANRRAVFLVDPHSTTFKRVQRIFDFFEYPSYLTVYQPKYRNLSVELKRLSLAFTVNRDKFLESSQLRAMIDGDQDCGTWYGLRSKIVLRDVLNPRVRSVLIPMPGHVLDSIKYHRHGIHVNVDITNHGDFGRYYVNDTLGRIDCPAEPWLLYTKALIHATTSFLLPDPLTKRTGTEEAVACLRSGLYQPWTPLQLTGYMCLTRIAMLSPTRQYYPKDSNSLQKVYWNDKLTTTIQYDGYGSIVQDILETNGKLTMFSSEKIELPQPMRERQQHLTSRSCARLRAFKRPDGYLEEHEIIPDSKYDSRDNYRASQRRKNILECVDSINRWPQTIHTTADLAGVLQKYQDLAGFTSEFEKILLTDRLDVDFGLSFGPLYRFCQQVSADDKFRLQFLFALISFQDGVDMDIIRVLIACSVLDDLRELEPPAWPIYVQFRQNRIPHLSYLLQLLKSCRMPYSQDFRDDFEGFNLHAKQRKILERREHQYETQTDADCELFAQFLLAQWPCLEPKIEGFSIDEAQIDIPKALSIIQPEWARLFQNMELSKFLEQVQIVLNRVHSGEDFVLPYMEVQAQMVYTSRVRGSEFTTLSANLMRMPCKIKTAPRKMIAPSIQAKDTVITGHLVSQETFLLEKIITNIIDSKASLVRMKYGQELMQSLEAFKLFELIPKSGQKPIDPSKLTNDIDEARRTVLELYNVIYRSFSNSNAIWLQLGGLFPCISTVTLLENLRSTVHTSIKFGSGMRESLVEYALQITTLQRLLRLESAFLKCDLQRLVEEQNNIGHSNWQPIEEPDWLLIEVEANLLIRSDQVDVARATISPASKSNSVLQMNMGQGKTSIIVPMVACKLANAERLVRIIVPKPLLLPTAQLLQGRLGSLLGRSFLHLPFSRKTPTNTVKTYFDLHKATLTNSGIAVALPEHLLSFRLSGLQRLSDGHVNEGNAMVKVQQWMNNKSRDVMDESDQILSLRTQLIYPSGAQKPVDNYPYRWETAQALLALVRGHLYNLEKNFPRSIEVIQRPRGGYPMPFFLRKDVEEALLGRLVADICNGRTSILDISSCSKSDRMAIRSFITEPKVSSGVAKALKSIFPDKPALKQSLFHVRGLLVHRILLLALKKRWHVQYGLHPERDPIAVPFYAKGRASDQAEWGHPDVAILLTCLAFYYDGLNSKQLHQSLEHVLKSDDPASIYDQWSMSCPTLPDALREWNSINLEDEQQMFELWTYFNFSPTIIDYYCNNFVFPAHAKSFSLKLQASGWEIPLSSLDNPNSMTTGFSGTNDNRNLLPLTLKQQDLPGLSHTNAAVLSYLLQPRNREYIVAADERNRHISEVDLLHRISEKGIRVLIDAGAQILEFNNESLARAWLDIDIHANAAVYFDDAGKPMLAHKGCRPVPLSASPYSDDLKDVVVYLDEAHCRGVDLKLPAISRGALTLGLGVTKDHIVQGAMRLRQLATTQAITFFAPPEVNQSILDCVKKVQGDHLDSYDVICWLLEQTCMGIELMQPLYYSQGIDYCRRVQAAADNIDFITDANQREQYLDALRQKEQLSLERLYGVKTKSKAAVGSGALTPRISEYVKELNAMRKNFRDTGDAVHHSALQEVEQEREVAYEIEAVREVQRPTHYVAWSFPGLDRDIVTFVKTGRLPAGSTCCEQAFLALRKTGVGRKFGINPEALNSRLFVSREFLRSVKVTTQPHDNFLRQVSWILWSPVTETALVVIPEETELLVPILRGELFPVCYLLTYAAPITRKMLVHFNDLKYYAIPALSKDWVAPIWLSVQLGIFSGALYFEFSHYEYLCNFLGFETDKVMEETREEYLEEGFQIIDGVPDENENAKENKSVGFTAKPLNFLQEWLSVRRKGQDFSHTPMGYVCQGKPLTETHPFFSKTEPGTHTKPPVQSNRRGVFTSKGFSADATHDDDNNDDWADMIDDDKGILIDGESDSEDYITGEESSSLSTNSEEEF
ncbi:hypothetical protein SBOR_3154 [Sclerotinia borealis F-4128]|uniref:ubiquitinyl hydrolase 1 n=1 Tax=Sclerotinia borealis (strain F-4128) TaxID=1432307 RepID=W9CI42_SCLBF|nr:hypothetical protein SBOR_3154 [Sclerotinia borealis F-4128]